MLPNSRLVSTRKRSNSAAPVYPIQQTNTKKGFMSRILPKSNETEKAKSGGIGKLFKKMSGNKYQEDEDVPQIRPIGSSKQQHSKIPLAPPPRPRTLSQPISQHFLTNLPDQYLTQRPTPLSETPPRKSSGSISIYSTFGHSTESMYSFNTVQEVSEDEFVDAHGSSQEDFELPANEDSEDITKKDSELAQSLLNWKRHSGHKRWSLQDKRQQAEKQPGEPALFASEVWTNHTEYSISLPEIGDPAAAEQDDSLAEKPAERSTGLAPEESSEELPEESSEELSEEKAKKTARQLWNEDESIVSREKMAEWLGLGQPFHTLVLNQYMQLFEFSDLRLDIGFRKLCSKLYFKAEAQQIDRILEAFACRYWECNRDCLLGSADIVYAVVYSLLLLNTDLHVAQGSHARMSRSEFIKNTMSTVLDQKRHEEGSKSSLNEDKTWEMEVESYLKEMYMSVKHYQILQPLTQRSHLVKRTSILGSRRVAGLKRSVNSIIRKSGIVDSMIIPEDFYPQPRVSMSSSQATSPRRESFSSVTSSNTSFSSRCGSPVHNMNSSNQSFQPTFSSRPPYYKEGMVMRKHLLENANQKARHREWKECYLEVKDGELFIKDMEKRWTFPLYHTLSNPLPGYNRQRPHVFAIQQSDGGVYLFQTSTDEQVHEWVSTCNYWAARTSKEPLSGGVGNMEYGWGHCLDDVVMDLDAVDLLHAHNFYIHDPDSVTIQEWLPPSANAISSGLSEREQYETLVKYSRQLDYEINEHRDRKVKVVIKFPSKCNNYTRVMTNWEAKAKYLLHEIIKYQNYCDILEKSLEQADVSTEKLIYQTSQVDLFKEINQELHFNL